MGVSTNMNNLKNHKEVVKSIRNVVEKIKNKSIDLNKKDYEYLCDKITNPMYYNLLFSIIDKEEWQMIVISIYYTYCDKKTLKTILMDLNNVYRLSDLYLDLLIKFCNDLEIGEELKKKIFLNDNNFSFLSSVMSVENWIKLLANLQNDDKNNVLILKKITKNKQYEDMIIKNSTSKNIYDIVELAANEENKSFIDLKKKIFSDDSVIERLLEENISYFDSLLTLLDSSKEVDKTIVNTLFTKENVIKLINNSQIGSLECLNDKLKRFNIDIRNLKPKGLILNNNSRFVITGGDKHYNFQNGVIMIVPSKGVISANLDIGVINFYGERELLFYVDSHAAVILYLLIYEVGLDIKNPGFYVYENVIKIFESINELPSTYGIMGSNNNVIIMHIEGSTLVFYLPNEINYQDFIILDHFLEEFSKYDLLNKEKQFKTALYYKDNYICGDDEDLDGFSVSKMRKLILEMVPIVGRKEIENNNLFSKTMK